MVWNHTSQTKLVCQLDMLVHDELRPWALDLQFFDICWISYDYFKFVWLLLTKFWNNYKIFKKHKKNATPVPMVLFHHVVTSPIKWVSFWTIFYVHVSQNKSFLALTKLKIIFIKIILKIPSMRLFTTSNTLVYIRYDSILSLIQL